MIKDLTINTSIGKVSVKKFIEKFLKVENENGECVSLKFRDGQRDLYDEICRQRGEGKPVRLNILKARQIGFSTIIAAIIFTKCIFSPGQKAVIVADTSEHASTLFAKYNFFYDHLPKELQLPKEKSNAKELVVVHANQQRSSIRIVVQGENAGRSGTYQYLHLSEVAFWQNIRSTLTSLLQTVNNQNLDSMVFFETTGNGFNEYKTRWDRDVSGNTNYVSKFYSWFSNENYKRKYTGFKLEPFEEDIQKKYKLSLEQIAFIHEKYLDLDCDLAELRQEYPSSPIEAFKSTGHSVFNLDLLQQRKEELLSKQFKAGRFTYEHLHSLDGMKISLKNVKFIENKRGYIRIFEEPIPGHPYVANLDPAMGGDDYFAIQVIDNYTGVQVARLHENQIDDDEVAYQLICLGRYYNNALLSAECNNPNGSYILQMAEKCGYPLIYQDSDYEELTDRYANKFGYKTKQNNKNVMITYLKIAFRENYRMINDYDTLCEMETFEVFKKTNKEQFMASGKSHDDLVMSLAGAYYCRNGQSYVVNTTPKIKQQTWSPFQNNEPKVKGCFIKWD